MAAATAAEFREALRQAQLLDVSRLEQLDELLGSAANAADLADVLVRRDWLTRFQANYLLEGRGGELALGPYRLVERLGKGGMGEVFKARQTRLGRDVALKIVRSEHLGHADAMQRIRREARAAAQLQHPNVVTIYDADEADGVFFIAMECVDGIDLARLVRQNGPLPIPEACSYARQAALGLQHAHEHGLVHRDIKPSNLIVTRSSADGSGVRLLKILDFGLARFADNIADDGVSTPTDQWLGTPDFIAPEQARSSKTVDIRADIFSLGCALYFLLTRRSAFGGSNRMEKLVARLTAEATPASALQPHVPTSLDAVLMRMLARSPDDRFATPADAALALEPFCQAEVGAVPNAPIRAIGAVNGDQLTVTAAKAPGERTPAGPERRADSGPTPLVRNSSEARNPTAATSMLKTPQQRRWAVAGAFGAVLALIVLVAVPLLATRKLSGDSPDVHAPPSPAAWFINSIGMKLARIPEGAFLMGAAKDEAEQGDDETPQHKVEIKKPFYLGVFEVTQREYQEVIGANPSKFSPLGAGAVQLDGVADTANYPVESVTWDEAVEFCIRLTDRERNDGRAYRLPTEAEWEYACRAKTTTPFHFGRQLSAADANFNGRLPYGGAAAGAARQQPLPVGSFAANALGLHDMHGNVWEWCQDRWSPYADQLRPGGADQSFGRALRGGAWNFQGADCRSAKRLFHDQDYRSPHVGFRVVCEP